MTGKEKVAMRVVESVVDIRWATGEILSPNWILDDIDGIKGATAERRLRELREEYLTVLLENAGELVINGKLLHWAMHNHHYGYRPSRDHANYWEYEKEFIEFLKDYVENKKIVLTNDEK